MDFTCFLSDLYAMRSGKVPEMSGNSNQAGIGAWAQKNKIYLKGDILVFSNKVIRLTKIPRPCRMIFECTNVLKGHNKKSPYIMD